MNLPVYKIEQLPSISISSLLLSHLSLSLLCCLFTSPSLEVSFPIISLNLFFYHSERDRKGEKETNGRAKEKRNGEGYQLTNFVNWLVLLQSVIFLNLFLAYVLNPLTSFFISVTLVYQVPFLTHPCFAISLHFSPSKKGYQSTFTKY